MITHELWELIEPALPSGAGRRGRPWRDHRQVLEAIAWRFRTGCPWRDVPAEFGPWQTLWKRHRRWSTDGTYQRVFEACWNYKIRPDSWTGCCRSTRPSFVPISTLPARPHAPQGARSNDKIPEPDDHGLGRSRGGLTTKVHALVDSGIHPVVVQLSPGQAGDNPRLVPLLDALADIGHRPAHLLATRPIATPPRGASCAAGGSATRFQNVVTRLNTAKRRARAGADHPRSTLSATASASPSSAASAGSSSGAASQPGTTSTPAPTSAVSSSPPSSSSPARVRRHALG